MKSRYGLSTPLMWSAFNGHVNCVRGFLSAGADVNITNDSGSTALHHAAAFGHEECVDLLIQAGADVNMKNQEGLAAIQKAALMWQFKCVDLLIKAGADVNDARLPPLVYALTYDDNLIQYFFNKDGQTYKPEKCESRYVYRNFYWLEELT